MNIMYENYEISQKGRVTFEAVKEFRVAILIRGWRTLNAERYVTRGMLRPGGKLTFILISRLAHKGFITPSASKQRRACMKLFFCLFLPTFYVKLFTFAKCFIFSSARQRDWIASRRTLINPRTAGRGRPCLVKCGEVGGSPGGNIRKDFVLRRGEKQLPVFSGRQVFYL